MLNTRRLFILFLGLVVQMGSYAQLTLLEQSLVKQGMVDVQTLDKSIQVSLMYTRPDNFCGKVLYKDLHHAYLHPKAAKALVKAQTILKKKHPELSLMIFDAVRPLRIQQIMWDKVKNTSKKNYVSNPANGGGLHNYGMALDISICDAKGDTITMGTKVDYMGLAAHITNEQQLCRKGILSRQALANRQLLRSVMKQAGFKPLSNEWWHFNYVSRPTAKKYYKLIQ